MSLLPKAMLACLLGAFVILPTVAVSADAGTAKAEPQTQNATEEKRKTLMADATSAIQETQSALKTLDEGKTSQAIAALERATGKLDLILARDPKLELAPAGVNVITYDVQGGLDAVKQVRKEAEDLIETGRLQEARRLLKNLASETVISVSNIPLATYPVAIKQAVKLIDENKIDDAKRVLQAALNTQVVVDTDCSAARRQRPGVFEDRGESCAKEGSYEGRQRSVEVLVGSRERAAAIRSSVGLRHQKGL